VVAVRCDASRPADLARLLARIRTSLPPLRGVVHAAMVLDDAPLERLDRTRVRSVLAAKAGAAWNLHRLTLEDPLDLFLMLGSVAAVIGPPGQGAYAAANASLVALARHRRALGLPALAVDLGAVSGAGHVAGRPETGAFLDRIGVRTMTPGRAWDAIGEALARGDARAIVADVDWAAWRRGPAATLAEAAHAPPAPADGAPGAAGGHRPALADVPAAERAALVRDHVAAIVGRVLQAPPGRIDRGRRLTDLGLDSLMAVEVTTAVERELGVAVSLADVLEGLSVGGLAERVLARDGAAVPG
jgi:acyl carrier protein